MVQLFKNKKFRIFFCKISLPGNNTRKCAEYFWVNLLIFAQISMTIHKENILENAGYCYLKINWLLCPWNRYEKNLISWISPWKRKYFRKYSSMWIQGPGTINSWKNQRSKSHATVPLKGQSHDISLLNCLILVLVLVPLWFFANFQSTT